MQFEEIRTETYRPTNCIDRQHQQQIIEKKKIEDNSINLLCEPVPFIDET